MVASVFRKITYRAIRISPTAGLGAGYVLGAGAERQHSKKYLGTQSSTFLYLGTYLSISNLTCVFIIMKRNIFSHLNQEETNQVIYHYPLDLGTCDVPTTYLPDLVFRMHIGRPRPRVWHYVHRDNEGIFVSSPT